jgi:hypothetical protein
MHAKGMRRRDKELTPLSLWWFLAGFPAQRHVFTLTQMTYLLIGLGWCYNSYVIERAVGSVG